ncbi:MAG: alpha/beta hydrolase [Chloroflexota bacterium]
MFNYPPQLPDAICETYKSINGVALNIWRIEPECRPHQQPALRPAILFFFGGGFRMGSPEQFASHARYLAKRGMVAMTADYRVADRHGVKGVACLKDAKSALQWVRANAERLGIDPLRIGASGGSAGGYLAAATAAIPGFEDETLSVEIRRPPDALILFNPGVVMAPIPDLQMTDERLATVAERMGAVPESISPYHHIMGNLPPTIIFHGQADTTIPYETVEAFTTKMHMLGNRCELVGYPGEEHGFFNIGRGDGSTYQDTVGRMDQFLTSLGWLEDS